MPNTINGSGANYDNQLVVPAVTELASIAGLQTVFQRLLDNAKYLYDRVFTAGVLAIRKVADIAALQALTGMVDGQVCLVESAGLFRYSAASSATPVTNWIVQPTVGGGRWFHAINTLKNISYGIAALDASARLDPSTIPYRIVNTLQTQLSTNEVFAVDGYASSLVASVPNCLAGDILLVDAFIVAKQDTTLGGAVKMHVQATETGIYAPLYVGIGLEQTITASFRWSVTGPGTVDVKAYVQKGGSGGNVTMFGVPSGAKSLIRVVHLRP